MLTPIGLAFLVVTAICLIVQPRGLVWVLSAAVPFSHTAMVVVGDNGVSPFWTVAIVAVLRLIYLHVKSWVSKSSRRAARLSWPILLGATLALVLFAVYVILITAVGPGIFADTGVITPRGGLDSQIGNYTPLTYTSSNFAQVAYVLVGVGLVLYLISEPPRSARVLEAAIVTGFALTLYKHFFLAYWPQEWFDSNPSYYYHWIFEGARERGPFAEPSLLGMFVGMSLAYLVAAAAVRAGHVQRLWYLLLALVGLYIYTVSYTGTALLSLGSVALVAVGYIAAIVVGRSSVRTRWTFAGVCAGVVVLAAVFWPFVARYTIDLVLEKLGSDSFDNRNASNANSFAVFLESWGLGVGLGSDRPSSLFFLLLSSVGLIGTALLFRTVAGYLAVGFRTRELQPVSWALMAQLVAQLVAKPDLSMPATWFLMAVLAAGYNGWLRERTANAAAETQSLGTRLATLGTFVGPEIRGASAGRR